jgi:HSP20 family molecular chaperone IbpA
MSFMADLARREGTVVTPRSIFSDVLGWDPFRNFVSNAGGMGSFAGIEVARTDDGGFTVEIPVAGYKPNEVEVTLEDYVLTVRGKSDKRQFTRSLLLPDEIDGDNIGANVDNGLLTLHLRVHPKAQPKKIDIAYNLN